MKYTNNLDEILKAVLKGDAEEAGNAMRRHVIFTKEALVEFLKQFPGV